MSSTPAATRITLDIEVRVDALRRCCVKTRDPSITADMKQENMRPKDGSEVSEWVAWRRGDLKDADQKR